MASSDPVTWQLALVIQAQLQTVLSASGFYTDIGTNVVVEDVQTSSDDSIPDFLPVVVHVDKTQRTSDPTVNKRQRSVEFIIGAGVRANLDNAMLRAHQIIADIEKVMDRQAPYAPINVRSAKLLACEIIKRPEGMNAIVVQCTGTANYLPS